MDERVRFVASLLTGRSWVVLCREFVNSRQSGHNVLGPQQQAGDRRDGRLRSATSPCRRCSPPCTARKLGGRPLAANRKYPGRCEPARGVHTVDEGRHRKNNRTFPVLAADNREFEPRNGARRHDDRIRCNQVLAQTALVSFEDCHVARMGW